MHNQIKQHCCLAYLSGLVWSSAADWMLLSCWVSSHVTPLAVRCARHSQTPSCSCSVAGVTYLRILLPMATTAIPKLNTATTVFFWWLWWVACGAFMWLLSLTLVVLMFQIVDVEQWLIAQRLINDNENKEVMRLLGNTLANSARLWVVISRYAVQCNTCSLQGAAAPLLNRFTNLVYAALGITVNVRVIRNFLINNPDIIPSAVFVKTLVFL